MTAGSQGVLNNLVTQFATPYDCIRELAQNSIDAGTSQVDVWVDYESGPGGAGVVTIHVDDFGEGMNEEIIDQQFTKLFASNKEGDLTKIGKFGIGFVSVFALQPEAVLVHTGRGGEYWEVLFHKDRSFSKTRLDVPLEGTQITVFLSGTPASTKTVAEKVHTALKKWCLYAETEITFENRAQPQSQPELINEPFGVEGEFQLHRVFPDQTAIAVAFSETPVYAFYNRGLALAHTDVAEQIFPRFLIQRAHGKSIKLKSRYLEHTLSRDSIVRDAHYTKAMVLVASVLERDVPQHILEAMQALAKTETLNVDEMKRYKLAVELSSTIPVQKLRGVGKNPLLLGFLGKRYSPKQIFEFYRETGHIFAANETNDVVERLIAEEKPVLFAPVKPVSGSFERSYTSSLLRFLRGASLESLWGRMRFAFGYQFNFDRALCHPNDVIRNIENVELFGSAQGLVHDAQQVITSVFPWFQLIVPATITPKSMGDNTIFFERGGLDFGFVPGQFGHHGSTRLLNMDHPHVKDLVELYATDRALAVYCLARVFMLQNHEWSHIHYDLMRIAKKQTGQT